MRSDRTRIDVASVDSPFLRKLPRRPVMSTHDDDSTLSDTIIDKLAPTTADGIPLVWCMFNVGYHFNRGGFVDICHDRRARARDSGDRESGSL